MAKEAAEKMRTEQDELRKKRDVRFSHSHSLSLSLSLFLSFTLSLSNPSSPLQSYYHRSRELKEKEMKIKDKMTDLKKAFENAKERKREMSTQKDIISKGAIQKYNT